MSTLIERMILRTRQPLSSLEPITPVRYALTTPGQQPDEAAITEIPPALADVLRPSLSPPPHGSRRQNAVVSNRPVSPSVAAPRTASPRSVTPGEQDPDAGARDLRAALERTERLQDRENPGDSRPMPAAHGEGPNSRDNTAAGPTAPALPIPVPARLRTGDLAEPPATTAASVDGTQDDEHASGPDITVTIGHIEVRAAPSVPARPAPPPFRPQVSLTDFLNGSRGSQR